MKKSTPPQFMEITPTALHTWRPPHTAGVHRDALPSATLGFAVGKQKSRAQLLPVEETLLVLTLSGRHPPPSSPRKYREYPLNKHMHLEATDNNTVEKTLQSR